MFDAAMHDPRFKDVTDTEQSRLRACMQNPEFVSLFTQFAKDLESEKGQGEISELLKTVDSLEAASSSAAPTAPTASAAAGGPARDDAAPRPAQPKRQTTAHEKQKQQVVRKNLAVLEQRAQDQARQREEKHAEVMRQLDEYQRLLSVSGHQKGSSALPGGAGSPPVTDRFPGASDLQQLDQLLRGADALSEGQAGPPPGTTAPIVNRGVRVNLPGSAPDILSHAAIDSLAESAMADVLGPSAQRAGAAEAPKPRPVEVVSGGDASIASNKVPESTLAYVSSVDYGDYLENDRVSAASVRGYEKVRLCVALPDGVDPAGVELVVEDRVIALDFAGYSLRQPVMVRLQSEGARARLRSVKESSPFKGTARRYLEITVPVARDVSEGMRRAAEEADRLVARAASVAEIAVASEAPADSGAGPMTKDSLAVPHEPPKASPTGVDAAILERAKEWRKSARQPAANAPARPPVSKVEQTFEDRLRENMQGRRPDTDIKDALKSVEEGLDDSLPKTDILFDFRGKVFSMCNQDLCAAYANWDADNLDDVE